MSGREAGTEGSGETSELLCCGRGRRLAEEDGGLGLRLVGGAGA